jgi:hypothetical protein
MPAFAGTYKPRKASAGKFAFLLKRMKCPTGQILVILYAITGFNGMKNDRCAYFLAENAVWKESLDEII